MRNKDYREIQISRSMLAFVFTAIIVLGIIIFLLGVSVGKKQASITKETQWAAAPIEKVQEEKPVSLSQEENKISQEIASHAKNKEKTEESSQKAETESPSLTKKDLYYIQVGAYTDKSSASKIAEKYKNMGLETFVIDPLPTDRRTIFRVRIGGYDTREEAEKVKESLMRKENKKSSDYFIIRGSV